MIRIFDRNFTFITEIDSYQSLIWTRRWHKIGEFQIVVNQHMENVNELKEGRIITNGPNKTGIIAHIEEVTSERAKGDDQLLVKGYDLKGLLAKRITIPQPGQSYDRLTASAETIMKGYVERNAVNTSQERIIPDLTIAPNQNRGNSLFYQTRFKPLHEELEKISLATGIGWDVFFNGNGYVFDVVEGRNLTTNQKDNPPVIFSAEFDNVKEQKFVESSLDYKNVAIVAGQGEGADREVVIVGNESGINRNEVFIDARDVENNANLPSRGEQKLSEYAKVESFETQVLTYGPFIYGEDWDLGDIVTVQNAKKTRTAHVRVVEVTEITETNGYRLDVVFGQPMPTIIEKVKREIDEPVAEGGSAGEPGEPGRDGKDGVGLEYNWQGTSLGVKREDEPNYQYRDLQGPKGDKGDKGEDGVSVTHSWNGTTLTVTSASGTSSADLQGPKGDKGERGPQGLQGEQGPPGPQGPSGKNLEFSWNGTHLGVRVEGETEYQYVNLIGPKGERGPQGIQGPQGERGPEGPRGKSLEFTWNGTSLGIRIEGQTEYQFVNLKGDKGDTGPQGPEGKQGPKGEKGDVGPQGPQGERGPRGLKGDKPNHQWNGSQLRFEKPDGTWGSYVDLKGPKGDKGDKGDIGPPGSDAEVTKQNVIEALGYTPVNKDGDTLSGNFRGNGSLFLTNSFYALGGESLADFSMTGLYDRNELINAAYRGDVTINFTGAGNVSTTKSELNKLFNGESDFITISGVDETTERIEVIADVGELVQNYSRAQWQPFVQYRLHAGSFYTWFQSVTVEVSTDGTNWYKPANGSWETTNFSGEQAIPSLWMGKEAVPTGLPGYRWRYAKFTLENIQITESYAAKGFVWITQLGLRHVSAPFTRKYVNVTGDTMYGPLRMEGNRITGVSNPVQPQDVATKQYVDDRVGGGIDKVYHAGPTAPSNRNLIWIDTN
jgi:Siphovirus ReqiPepy6 Gp37-like protein/Collagen triple helix repeat (20 copies)